MQRPTGHPGDGTETAGRHLTEDTAAVAVRAKEPPKLGVGSKVDGRDVESWSSCIKMLRGTRKGDGVVSRGEDERGREGVSFRTGPCPFSSDQPSLFSQATP